MALEDDLESYVSSVLEGYEPKTIETNKIIRDAVLGTHVLSPAEVHIMDTPFVQRLRGIHQTALAYLTYPSSTHTRFEHSLGVSIMAYRMGKSLSDRKEKIDPITLDELKIAGLLHDIGHGPFSHASEEVICDLKEAREVFENEKKFSKEKSHEMITYKILHTSRFKDFFYDTLKKYKKDKIRLDSISDMVIGIMQNRAKDQYKADIMNGAFDADKLDYLTRDAYFTGIKMAIDLDRIMATQFLEKRKGEDKKIIVDFGGVHILEQILFNKMLLYPSVYHHHKVRSALCLFKSIFEMIKNETLIIDGLGFNRVTDFLSVDDNFFLSEKGKPPKIAQQILKIKNRNLLKRALVISRKTFKTLDNVEKLLSKKDRPDDLRKIAVEIARDHRLRDKCEYYDIWIDLPTNPRFPEPSQCLVRVTRKDYLPLDDFFPVTEWSHSFDTNKWKGFVFGPPELQKTVAKVSKEILESLFDVEFNDQAVILAKHATSSS